MKRYLLSFFFVLIIALTACAQASPATSPPDNTSNIKTTSTSGIQIETETPTPDLVPSAPRAPVYYSSLSPDRSKLAVCISQNDYYKDGKLFVYKVTAQGTLAEPLWGTPVPQSITDLVFSPDGNLLIVILDGYFIVWLDANTGQTVHMFRGNQSNPNLQTLPDVSRFPGMSLSSGVRSIFSPDGKWLATWDRHPTALLWDVNTGERAGNFTDMAHGYIRNAVYSADGKYLVTRYHDRIDLWNMQTRDITHMIPLSYADYPFPVFTGGWLAISPDDSTIAFGEDTMTQVLIWDLAQGRIINSIPITGPADQPWFPPPPNLAFSSDGTLLAIPLDHEIAVHRLSDGGKQFAIPVSGDYPDYYFSLLPGNILSLHDSIASTMFIWDLTTGAQLWSMSLPADGSPTTDSFASIPTVFGDTERFALTLPPTDIASLRMIDANRGWGIASNGWMVHTRDGGNSWKKVSPIEWGFHAEDYFALDADHAWVIQYAAQPVVWHTSDGGQTWESTELTGYDGTRGYTIHFEFRDDQHGWYFWAELGSHGFSTPHLEKTGDGGKTWEHVIQFEPLGSMNYTGLLFVNEHIGFLSSKLPIDPDGLMDVPLVGDYLSGKALPQLQRTIDSGMTWNIVQLPRLYPIPEALQALSASDRQMTCGVQNIGHVHPFSTRITAMVHCVVGRGSSFDFHYFSSNSGESWFNWQPAMDDFAVNDYVDSKTGWRQVNDGRTFLIQKTSDDGQTWNTLANLRWPAIQLDFVNEETGWALAGNNDQYMLWHTLDGGRTWEQFKPVLSP